jgi:hypothetical protein
MPTRRIFVKRAAGTALIFGAGINLANAAAVTSNNSGGTCGINQYELSGQY